VNLPLIPLDIYGPPFPFGSVHLNGHTQLFLFDCHSYFLKLAMKRSSHRVQHDRLTGETVAIFGSFVVIDVLVAVFVLQFSLLNDLRNEAGTMPK